ncbi:hypothetical protein KDA00_05300 [Candidatus Saccharibacteria bacterium]|nr:hypothetical protein [Candidatus Saccharibacteria bacterium]
MIHHFAHGETITHIHTNGESSPAIYVFVFAIGIITTLLLTVWALNNRKHNKHTLEDNDN